MSGDQATGDALGCVGVRSRNGCRETRRVASLLKCILGRGVARISGLFADVSMWARLVT